MYVKTPLLHQKLRECSKEIPRLGTPRAMEKKMEGFYLRTTVVSMIFRAAVEPFMPDRSKVRYQTKRDTGVHAVRG